MTDVDARWSRLVWDALVLVPGGEELDALRATWVAHEARDLPVLTIFGGYDAGKSSLLKRLLLEAGQPQPEWLTVSARRETFEIGEVDALGWTVRDTPGISGGNTAHEQAAREGCLLSDAYLVVLPPQLLTGERDDVLDLLSGRLFSDTWPSMQAVPSFVVIARMDEAGVDPETDEAGFHELSARKLREFDALLGKSGLSAHVIRSFPVAADPYQHVGNRRDVNESELQQSRRWDGISGLLDTLRAMSARTPTLRRASAVRFAAFALSRAAQSLDDLRADRVLTADGLSATVERYSLASARLGAFERSARSQLEATVQEQLLAGVRRGANTASDLLAYVEPRLSKALHEWNETQTAELVALLGEVSIAFARVERSATARSLHDHFVVSEAPAATGVGRKLFATVHRFGPQSAKVLKKMAEADLGMPLSKAAEHLEKLKAAEGNFSQYVAKVRKTQTKFASEQQAAKAARYVGLGRGLALAGPILVGLAGLAAEEISEREAAEKARARADNRARLRLELDAAAARLVDGVWTDWTAPIAPVRAELEDAQRAAEALRGQATFEIETLERHLDKLRELAVQQPLVPI